VFPDNPEVGAPVGNLGAASWEGSLNDRDRKSLYENFARELPVEYRDILSLYFQTLAEQPR